MFTTNNIAIEIRIVENNFFMVNDLIVKGKNINKNNGNSKF